MKRKKSLPGTSEKKPETVQGSRKTGKNQFRQQVFFEEKPTCSP